MATEVNQNGGNDGKGAIDYGGDTKDIQGWAVQSQQPPKGAVNRWERFLHVRSIKVLLVENDDSTRQLVTALLRNSNYEVIQAANGLQAWNILADLKNHIDLVLTEVVMPGLSGIGLLSKIMGHHLRKNIPVITMSSYDSMALVFKCLSRGAVDFLVKPIRKNELKNLWQHIWRRYHSSSGSESESGAKTEGSSSGDAYNSRTVSFKAGLKVAEGSGTRTTGTEKAIEVESSPAMCTRDQTADTADNTSILLIHQNNNVQFDSALKGKELVTRKKRKFVSKSNDAVNGQVKFTRSQQNSPPELDSENNKRLDMMPAHRSTAYLSSEYKAVITNCRVSQRSSKSICDYDSEEPVCIGLNKLRENGDKSIQTNRNLLRCSELSAFFRYNMPTNEIRQNTANGNILPPGSNDISKITDIGSSTNKISKEATKYDFNGFHLELPVQHTHHHIHPYHDNEFSLKKSAGDSPHCGLPNELGGPVGGQPVNYILNRSGSSSKHGSSTGGNAGDTNVHNTVSLEGKGEGGTDASGRETALTKYCQKKKEPCFQKQVRCQNREESRTEERSRVYFVRKKGHLSSDGTMD